MPRYEGFWVDGKMHGRGVYQYADGDRYDGEWKDDKRHGKGVVTYVGTDGKVVEKYDVRARRCGPAAGVPHRLLLLLPPAARSSEGQPIASRAAAAAAQGDWFEGKMHGQGAYTYADGGVYQVRPHTIAHPAPERAHTHHARLNFSVRRAPGCVAGFEDARQGHLRLPQRQPVRR